MNTISIISLCISGVMMVVSIITAIVSQSRANKHDTTEVDNKFSNIEKTLVEVRVNLEEVRKTVTETKQDVKGINVSISELDKRLTKAEEQLKTAFVRIDELRETKVDRMQ